MEKVSIYFEVSKEANMGQDEQGKPCEIYAKIDLGKLNPEWRQNMIEKLGEDAILQLASEIGSFKQEHLTEITKEEYERNDKND